MGLETKPANGGGGSDRDHSDFERLRHARERHGGFPVGRYLQPAPMLFTRDGHNVFLGDMYRGHSVFLLCSGPSLKSLDLSQLGRRGIITCAVNNAATVYRPQLWTSTDDPANFSDAIWYDPGITKFVPLCHMEKRFAVRDASGALIPSPELVGDMPAVFGYRRNEAFRPEQWLHEDTFNWGNHSERTDALGLKGSRSVMYVALRLLFYLGFRRVYLLGCDFRMEYGRANYAFEQERSRASVRGNNESYRILNIRLNALKPYFEQERFQVVNCTPDSGLRVFDHLPFEAAVSEAAGIISDTIVTAGMYDRKQREKDSADGLENGADYKEYTSDKTPGRSLAPAADQQPSRPMPSGATRPPVTVVTMVDEPTGSKLRLTWHTWMRHQPWLRDCPIVVVHNQTLDPVGSGLSSALSGAEVKFVPCDFGGRIGRPDAIEAAWLRIPAEHVNTAWYLRLDPAVVALPHGRPPPEDWFGPGDHGGRPVFVAHRWGYTKPADALDQLDLWGDSIPELRDYPKLNLPRIAGADRIEHPRVSGWYMFARTDWTRRMAAYAPDRLPAASDTFLFYCGSRRGDPYRRIRMLDFGWEHVSNISKLRTKCIEILGGCAPSTTAPQDRERGLTEFDRV